MITSPLTYPLAAALIAVVVLFAFVVLEISDFYEEKDLLAKDENVTEGPEKPLTALTTISDANAQQEGAYVVTQDGTRHSVDSVTFFSTGLQPVPAGGVKLRIEWADSSCFAGWVRLKWNGKSGITAATADKRDLEKCP